MLLSVLPEQTVGDHLCGVENRHGEERAHAANHQTGSGDEAGHDAQAQEWPEVICSLVPRSTQCFADAGFGMIDQIDRGEYPTHGEKNTRSNEKNQSEVNRKPVNKLTAHHFQVHDRRQSMIEAITSAVVAKNLKNRSKDAHANHCADDEL